MAVLATFGDGQGLAKTVLWSRAVATDSSKEAGLCSGADWSLSCGDRSETIDADEAVGAADGAASSAPLVAVLGEGLAYDNPRGAASSLQAALDQQRREVMGYGIIGLLVTILLIVLLLRLLGIV